MSRAETALVVLNMGGAERPQDIEPFLKEMFADRAILPLPTWLRLPLARFISRRRAPKVQPNYEEVGGSPIRRITREQAEAIAAWVSDAAGEPVAPLVAMRYSPPRADEAVRRLVEAGARRVVVLSLFPHYSTTTTESSILDFQRALAAEGVVAKLGWIESFYDDPGYLDALAETVREGLARFSPEERGEVQVVFSAHGLPVAVVRRGDPYPDHVAATIAGVMKRLDGVSHHLCYQSRVGPVKWLPPSTHDKITEIAAAGHRKMLVVPVSFVSDHIETLHELDIELARFAKERGIERYERAPALNTRPDFVAALGRLVRAKLEEMQRAETSREEQAGEGQR